MACLFAAVNRRLDIKVRRTLKSIELSMLFRACDIRTALGIANE